MSSIADKPDFSGLEELLPKSQSYVSLPRRFEKIATLGEIAADFLAATCGVLLGYRMYRGFQVGRHLSYPTVVVVVAALGFALLFILMLDREGAYRVGHGLLHIRETERTLRVSVQAFLLIMLVTFLAGRLVSRLTLALAFVLVPLIVALEKQVFFMVVRSMRARGRGVRKVILYGAGKTGKRVFTALVRSPKLGLDPVVVVDDDEQKIGQEMYAYEYKRQRSAKIIAGPITPELIKAYGADAVVIAIANIRPDKFSVVAGAATQSGASLAYVPSQMIAAEAWVEHADLDGLFLAMVSQRAPMHLYEFVKRIFDLCGSLIAAVIVAPVLVAIAIAVRLDSKGPILFRQLRVGRNGRLFQIYKFRSMRSDAPQYDFSPEEAQDPRITRVGRFLRRTSLDELPQLFNVIRGEMSLVGPRPEMPFLVAQYGAIERQRLGVTPGITGLWQLSADRAFQIHENIHYDLYYIRHRGFFMDMAILLHTIFFAINGI